MSFAREYDLASIAPHPASDRLYRVEVDPAAARSLLDRFEEVDSQRLNYVPYLRLILADAMQQTFGADFMRALNGVVRDRGSGGFTIQLEGEHTEDELVRWSTAITHAVGLPNFDAMTGSYYAIFAVRDTDECDSYLRQAYRTFTLHTDGTFVDDRTDWLMMMKMDEANAVGGRSRLLHLDDWDDLGHFVRHPVGSEKILYKSPPSKNVSQTVERTTFFEHEGRPCACFIDQFANPKNTRQARYLQELSESMESAPQLLSLELRVGELIVLNNLFWMHGREAFERHPDLNRVLMRQRGCFAPTLDEVEDAGATSAVAATGRTA